MTDWPELRILSIPIWNWILALVVATLVATALGIALKIIKGRLKRQEDAHGSSRAQFLLTVLSRTSGLAIIVLALLIGLKLLELPETWARGVSTLWFAVIVFQAALWLDVAMTAGLLRHLTRRVEISSVTMTLVTFAARTILWAVAVLAILDNLGVNITAFVTSLGIGGVAVALAAQVVLGDLFASVSIGLDKPFEVGDFVVFNDIAGNIEHVGLKTTRIRSLSGEQVVCANTELLKQTLHNYKRMDLRRVAFKFVVSYRTPRQAAAQIGPAVKDIITNIEGTRFDRAHLLQFTERGLEYEVVYYVLSADYNAYMDIQQGINFAIMSELESRGLEFGWYEMNVRLGADQEAAAQLAGATHNAG